MLLTHFGKLVAKANKVGLSSDAEPKKADLMSGEGDLPPRDVGNILVTTDTPPAADFVQKKEVESSLPDPERRPQQQVEAESQYREEIPGPSRRPDSREGKESKKRKKKKSRTEELPVQSGKHRYYLGPPSPSSSSGIESN
jgi:hypothetical protein